MTGNFPAQQTLPFLADDHVRVYGFHRTIAPDVLLGGASEGVVDIAIDLLMCRLCAKFQ